MSEKRSPAPAGLGAAGVRLWVAVTAGLTLRADEYSLLEAACRCADQVEALDAVLASSGSMIAGSKGQQVLHPAIPELRQQRQVMASLLGRLDIPEGGDGLGTEWDGLSASQRARRAARARWDRKAS